MLKDSYGSQRFYGIYRGLVKDNADPFGMGRVKLQIPQILFEAVTDWAWPRNDHGVHVDPPAIGQGVWVQFEGGDPSFPVWVGTFGTDTTVLNLKLNELTDVNTAGVTNGQTIVYQSSTSSWIPGAGGGSGSVTSITAGTNLTGGTITSTGTIALSATPTGVTSINGVTLPTSGSFITSATTSLPNVTSVNSTTIPASSTLVTTSDTIAASKISGTAVTQADTGTVTSTMILNGTILDADINASANISVDKLSSKTVTVGSTSVNLGATTTSLSGLTSVSSAAFTGALTGNASTATTLETARTINTVSFNGSANIIVKASTTNTLGLTSSGNLAFSSGTTWDGGTSGITIGLSTTPTGITSINTVTMPTTGSFITSATTSLPNVTSVNGTTIPSATTLVSTSSSSLTSNGVILGAGTSTVSVTTAGSANQPLRVPSGGGAPAFGSLDISQSAVVGSSILPIANGGTNASTTATARSNLGVGAVTLSDSAPASPAAGDIWVCTLDQTEYVYFVDATPNPSGLAGQWVQIQANAAIDTALTNRVSTVETQVVPTGSLFPFAGASSPTGYALCNGASVSTSGTYANLFGVIGYTYGGSGASFNLPDLTTRIPVGYQAPTSLGTATITIATPGVITKAAHGLATGQVVYLTTTGALPTGITANTRYWVNVVTSSTFTLATSLANALAGTVIATSGTQSGTHTVYSADFDLGRSNGEKAHTQTTTELVSHTHTSNAGEGSGSGATRDAPAGGSDGYKATYYSPTLAINSTGGGLPMNNMQPYLTTNYIIKL